MTLADILPSLGIPIRQRLDQRFWPDTARWMGPGELAVGGKRLTAGHVLDESCVRAVTATYAAAFGAGGCSYSANAGLTPDIARLIAEAGLGCYCGSAEQLRIALAAGIAPSLLTLTGAGKSVAALDAAFACGAAVVVGSVPEATTLMRRAPAGQRVLVRVVPSGHRCPRRYGVRLGTSSAIDTVRTASHLDFQGLDCSLGHGLDRFGTFERCLREVIGFSAVLRAKLGVTTAVINLGGGQADELPVGVFAARMRGVARVNAERYQLTVPQIRVSPGHAVTARAGVTVCEVEHVLRDRAGRLVAGLAGDLPSFNGHAVLLGRVSASAVETGTLCGDHSSAPAPLPGDLAPGDLLALAGAAPR